MQRCPRRPRAHHLAALGFVVMLGSACDKLREVARDELSERVERVQQNAKLDEEPVEQSHPAQALTYKLSLYATCIHRSGTRLRDTWARYSDFIKTDKGTPKVKKAKPFVYKIESELDPCQEAIDRGPKLEPSLPELEAAMVTYVERSRGFARLVNELHVYYAQERYAQDQWAKGKAMAPSLAQAFTEWSAASKTLTTGVDAKQDKADRQMLELVEKQEGRKLQYFARAYMIAARAMAQCVNGTQLEPKACDSALADLTSAKNAFEAYHEANHAEAVAVFWMSSFSAFVDRFHAESEAYVARLRKRRQKPAGLARVQHKYRGLVAAAARLRFDFPS